MSVDNPSPRIMTLDALRGFAVMGILTMNIGAFAFPEQAYFNPLASGEASIAERLSWTINFILFDGKMRGLFSLLFGASIMLIIKRSEENGKSPASTHYWRMVWLAIFGLFHFYFIWWGDILFLYAIAGCIAYLFRGLASWRLILLALLIYVAGMIVVSLLMGSLLWIELAANMPSANPREAAEYAQILQELKGDYARQIYQYQMSYAAITGYRLTSLFWQPYSQIVENMFETLPLMLIGMAMFKNGFITGAAHHSVYFRWAKFGLVGGFGGYAVLAGVSHAGDFRAMLMYNVALAWNIPFLLFATVGYMALLLLLFQRLDVGGALAQRVLLRVSAVGRAAFSNYIGTSIVMTSIFYGYGLGLFGEVRRDLLWFFVAGGCAGMLVWSKIWLDHYLYGPLEWLWRSLARGALQPMRRN